MNDERSYPDLVLGLPLDISAEFGRATMRLSDVLALGTGSIVALDRKTDDPVDVLVNEQLIARGEIVAVDDRFGVRITEIVARPRT